MVFEIVINSPSCVGLQMITIWDSYSFLDSLFKCFPNEDMSIECWDGYDNTIFFHKKEKD